MKENEPIDESLSLIGQKCTKLSKLDLSIEEEVPISERFFDVISEFKAIQKLSVELYNNTVLSGSVECFKHCKQLYDIDITSPALTEDFFANMETFVPKLKTLRIGRKNQFSNSFINSFKTTKICLTVLTI